MLYVADSQVGFAPKIIQLIPNFWVDSYRGYVGTILRFSVFGQQALSLSLGRVMPHCLDAMLANRWFILAPTSSSSVKSASRDFRRSTSALASAVLAVTSTSLGFDSSRNSVMSASEGEILHSSSLRLRLPDASWSSSPDSESALERSWWLWRCFFCGFESCRAAIVCNNEAIAPMFTLISESVFARVSPGWLDKPASAG